MRAGKKFYSFASYPPICIHQARPNVFFFQPWISTENRLETVASREHSENVFHRESVAGNVDSHDLGTP